MENRSVRFCSALGATILTVSLLLGVFSVAGAAWPVRGVTARQQSVRAYSSPEEVLYNFQAPPDGGFPTSAVIQGSAGQLYGATSGGGEQSENGVVYELKRSHDGYAESILYAFLGGLDGSRPYGGLLEDTSGTLYGTTYVGGGSGCTNAMGCGTVFKLSPAGNAYAESILYRFQGGNDGASPLSNLVSDASGDLYGTTSAGGPSNAGTVFELAPSGAGYTETILYAFAGGDDGSEPSAGLQRAADGRLRGTTLRGGGGGCNGLGCGTAYELTPSGGTYFERILHSFRGAEDGANPMAGLTADIDGTLYGTTEFGGGGFGTVFALAPRGSSTDEAILYRFRGGYYADGSTPLGGITVGPTGRLYGTTLLGGPVEAGTLFELTPPTGPRSVGAGYAENILHMFQGPPGDGALPEDAPLMSRDATALIGTTFNGGSGGAGLCNSGFQGCGTVFAFKLPAK